MVAYATREDVYLAGLPRGSVGQRARAVASVDATANTLEVAGHGLAEETPVQLQVDASSTLPAPLSASTVYYAKLVTDSDSLLQLAATPGGAAINLTNVGAGSLRLFVPIGQVMDRQLEVYSRWFDGKAIAHGVPFESPYPIEATNSVAIRTGAHVARLIGLGREGEKLYEQEALLLRDIDPLVRGMRIRDAAVTTASSNLARGSTPGTSAVSSQVIP